MDRTLRADRTLAELGIPVDIVYEQGPTVLFANPNKR